MKEVKLEEIQNTMHAIYIKNINFFKINQPQIYNDILELESKNRYRYDLNFTNHFELIDENNEPIYNCDPYYDSQCRVNNLINGESNFLIIKIDEKYEKRKTYDSRIDIYRILNNYIRLIDKRNIEITKKFIFLGTILGVHISEIVNKSEYQIFLIVEDNIEIFRLSLFLNDYEDMCKNKKIFFSINNKNKDDAVKNFLQYLPQYNNKIKFDLASEKEIYLIDEVLNSLLQENELNYPFSEYLISYLRGLNYLREEYNLLKLGDKYSILKDYKILFIGGGLSLNKEIEFVKENKNKFLIVCVAATLKILQNNDVVPDIIITSDSSLIIKEQFLVEEKYFKNSLIFASNKTDKQVLDILPKNNIFLFNDSLEILNDTGINVGVNVGNIGYSILLKLGVKEIYLLGFDACIDEKSMKSHSTSNKTNKYGKFNIFEDNVASSEENLIKVKGNFRDFVFTTVHFKSMIECFSEINKIFNVKAYNLSDGACLEGISPKYSREINLKQLANIDIKKIKNSLLTISKSSLDSLEIKYLKDEKILMEKLRNLSKTKLETEFYKIYLENRNSLILQILDKYFILVLPYYNYSSQINEIEARKMLINDFYSIIDFIDKNIYI